MFNKLPKYIKLIINDKMLFKKSMKNYMFERNNHEYQ